MATCAGHENASGYPKVTEGVPAKPPAPRWRPLGGNGRELVLFIYMAENMNGCAMLLTATIHLAVALSWLAQGGRGP
jgi:hypothetical protein